MGPFTTLSAVQAAPTPALPAPSNHGRVLYSSPEQDPFRLAALPARGGRSRKRREAFSKAFECLCSAEVCLQAGRPADAAAAVVEAYWHSEGLLELSHSFQSLMHSHESLQLGSVRRHLAPGSVQGEEQQAILLMHALRALAATEWETAASLATWALATLSSNIPVDEIAPTQFAWTAHTIMGSVHQRLMQCPSSTLPAAAAANAAALEHHATKAAALRPAGPRADFERGWCAWSRGSYLAAAKNFRASLLTAAEADDDVFGCAAGWALAMTAAQGGWGGPTVPVSHLQGLVAAAKAAEGRLAQWGMAAAVCGIAAFARGPMRCVDLPHDRLAVYVEPALRQLPIRREGPRRCESCGTAFISTLGTSPLKTKAFCSTACRQQQMRADLEVCP